MLEDYLLGNKTIRNYCSLFNQKDFNKIIRCTLILGIHNLEHDIPNFNKLTAQEIESVIIDNL